MEGRHCQPGHGLCLLSALILLLQGAHHAVQILILFCRYQVSVPVTHETAPALRGGHCPILSKASPDCQRELPSDNEGFKSSVDDWHCIVTPFAVVVPQAGAVHSAELERYRIMLRRCTPLPCDGTGQQGRRANVAASMLVPGASFLGGHLIQNSSKRGGEVCKAGL